MSSYRSSLDLAINAIQAHNMEEGARLLRIALRSQELTGSLRSVAYMWLAETQDDASHKRACYSEALAADPNNNEARERLARLLASQLPRMPDTLPEQATPGSSSLVMPPPIYPHNPPPAPPSSPPPAGPPPARYVGQPTDHIVGIFGGPNGPGTGFFIAPEAGMLATTRYLVGGIDRVTVETPLGHQLPGYVVRSYPEIDLAFVRIDYNPGSQLAITPQPQVSEDLPLTAAPYRHTLVSGAQRPTKRVLANHWISTNFMRWEDGGGAPIFDTNWYLVGMATRNTSRNSGYYYALHAAAIRARADAYLAQLRAENRPYCPHCGASSRAGLMGFFYCEVCGAVLPQAMHVQRGMLPQAEALYDYARVQCMRCGAQVGFHEGRCLRCGQPPQTRPLG
jgi:hypothetical protein